MGMNLLTPSYARSNKMSRTRRDAEFINDLELFCRMCSIFDKHGGQVSFVRMSKELGVPSSTLQSCRDRLENDLGVVLIDSKQKSSKNSLTADGKELFEKGGDVLTRIRKLKRSPLKKSSIIPFILSPSLTVHLFPAVIRQFLNQERSKNIDITLKIEDHVEMEQTIKSIDDGEADFAVIWDFHGREESVKNTGLIYYKFVNRFDLVIICSRHHRFAAKLQTGEAVRLGELASETVLCLQGLRQPLHDQIPYPIDGGQRIVMDLFSTIISFLRAGHNGVAIVPGFYREFDYYRKSGELIELPLAPVKFNEDAAHQLEKDRATETVGVAAIFRGKYQPRKVKSKSPLEDNYSWPAKESPSGDLLLLIDEYLRKDLHRPGWEVKFNTDTNGMTTAFSRLEEFRDVWYVWCDRIGIDQPNWRHAEIHLNQPQPINVDEIRTIRRGFLTLDRDAGQPTAEMLPLNYAISMELLNTTLIHLRAEATECQRNFAASFNMNTVENGTNSLLEHGLGTTPLGGP